MYSYDYDPHSGGLLLNTSPLVFSKEPRPVYYQELDLLGFDKYWNYDKQDALPYMWAEASKYYYFGRYVAQVKGGDLFTAPEIEIKEDPESNNGRLKTVDIQKMNEKNDDFLITLQQETVRKIENVWNRHKDKLDVFHVAFSGGKDSIVMLDLVKKALPKDAYIVIFGDTQMEFPDTYEIIDKVEAQCKAEGIKFYRAKSHLEVKDSWRKIGPPSQTLRWCCSVHKSNPQTNLLRELLNKDDFIGMDFVGVRAAESLKRSEYEYENYGKKQKGQYSHNPILEWTSAEVWLYSYKNKLEINTTYKKGNSRAGCLLCPMGGGRADYMRYANYANDVQSFADIISDLNIRDEKSDSRKKSYITNRGWSSRKNGRDLKIDSNGYTEKIENEEIVITASEFKTDWEIWLRTLGHVEKNSDDRYTIAYNNEIVPFEVQKSEDSYKIYLSSRWLKRDPTFAKLFKQNFRKAAFCIACRTCETNCQNGCISFVNGLSISNKCVKCQECQKLPTGCLVYASLKLPTGEGKIMKSINSFADHAPKPEWIRDFFSLREGFISENNLGPMMIQMFKRFLRDADLIGQEPFTRTAKIVDDLGWDTATSWGILISNLAYNPQFEWYIKNLNIGVSYNRAEIENMLRAIDISEKDAKSIVKSLGRISNTPIGTALNWCHSNESKGRIDNIIRNKCYIDNPLVILYSLYKYAEKCGDYYEFTVSRLFNENIESDGISPVLIFGVERDEIETILRGLNAKYPDYINSTFTHDLDKISLNSNKKSTDIIELLEGING
jgi:phosphoadenosine phosphosulfate reductase